MEPTGYTDCKAAVTKAVVANAVLLLPALWVVPMVPVGSVGVPVNTGEIRSALVAIAVAMLLNSVSISVPLTILSGSPEGSASLVAKLVLLV